MQSDILLVIFFQIKLFPSRIGQRRQATTYIANVNISKQVYIYLGLSESIISNFNSFQSFHAPKMNRLNSTSATSWTFFTLLESIARALGQTARLDEALQAIDSIDSLTGCEKVKRYQTPKRSSNIRLSAFFNSATKTATHGCKKQTI